MGLRCLLGHDFGEPETERERNEEGNEVVVTVREVKTCRRCGEKQVVSENKEIKSIDQLRESATAGRTDEPSGSEPTTSDPAGDDGWSTGGSVGGVDEPTSPGQSGSSADQWSTDELEVGGDSTEPEPAEPSVDADDADDVDEGVAEIIESAEREDDMLRTDEGEGGADETEPDDQQPDASEEDAEILDADGPSDESREQWDEEADPSQVPGQDQTDVEADASDGEDAIIMGGDETPVDEDASPEPVETQPSESEPAEQADDEPTAVESEDAVILDDDGGDPAPAEPAETGDENADPEDAVAMDESTEETGHTPWPETPGEDEGHDATAPDGEPAEVEFGGGLTPDEPQHEANGTEADASSETAPGQPTAESGADAADADESGGTNAPEPNINLEQSSREAQLEYYCSECGLTRDVGNSSMRAGDICPDCRKGYITEREKAE